MTVLLLRRGLGSIRSCQFHCEHDSPPRFCFLLEVPELRFIYDISGHRLGYSGYTCKGIFAFYYYCEAERKKGLGRFTSDPSVDRFLLQ